MCMLTVRNTRVDERPSHCPIKDPALKDLDDSRSTAITVDSEVENEIPITRLPIVICEDDAHHNYAKETYFHTSLIKDSVQVQKYHKVNDDERHEENPHLEDFLIPHHSVHIERPEEAEAAGEKSTTDNECSTQGILHTKASAPKETQEKQRKVHFGTVVVRDYDIILGDHPCCSYGPPLTLDWDYLEYEPLDVNEYEFHHPPRRNVREMVLNYYLRKKLLSNAGYTKLDFKLSKKEVKRAKLNRSLTRQIVAHYPLSKVEAAVESACRKLKRLIKEDHWKADRRCLAV